VVGFEQEHVDALEADLTLAHVAEVGAMAMRTASERDAKTKPQGRGVVGNGEGRDGDVADGEVEPEWKYWTAGR